MTGTFDPAAFMQTEVEGSLDTKYPTIPEGEYQGVIDKVEARTPKDSVIMEVFWKLDDDALREATGLDNPQVRQSIFLDVDAETGMMEMGQGKNIGLGRLREALNQNDGGAWSPNYLIGQVANVTVGCRTVTTDKEGNELPEAEWKTYNDVKAVTAI